MRIIIIGNSHVGALKRAWDQLKDSYIGIEIYFVAAASDLIKNLEIHGNKILTQNSLLNENIKLTFGNYEIDYKKLNPDVCLFYGMNMGCPSRFIRRSTLGNFTKHFVNNAMNDYFSSHAWGYEIAEMISLKFKGNFYASHPIASSHDIKLETFSDESYEWVSNAVSYFNKILIKKNIKYFIQPYKTFHPSRYQTFLEFSINSQRLGIEDGPDAKKHPNNDFTHMNNKFGTVFLESFINEIS